MLLSSCGFNETVCVDSCTLLKSVKELWPVFYTFASDLVKIRYIRCPQKFIGDDKFGERPYFT
jgi:hypothetical protein